MLAHSTIATILIMSLLPLSVLGIGPYTHSVLKKFLECDQGVPSKIVVATPITLNSSAKYGSISGYMSDAYVFYFNWLNLVRGGVVLGGIRHCVELVMVDDGSSRQNVARVTNILLRQGVDLFLSPYSSGLTMEAAQIVNVSGHVLMSGAASNPGIYYDRDKIFGVLPPSTVRYREAFAVLRNVTSSGTTIAYVQENFTNFVSACRALNHHASPSHFSILKEFTLSDSSNVSEITEVVEGLGRLSVDILVCCVYSLGCRNILNEVKKQKLYFEAIVVGSCVTDPDLVSSLGDAARYVLGTTVWTADSQFTCELTGFSASNWTQQYENSFGVTPPYQAASAFAASAVLMHAVQQANTTDPRNVSAELRRMRVSTIFGNVKFDSNGQGEAGYQLVQHQRVGLVDKIVIVNARTIVYPRPTWQNLSCSSDLANCTMCPMGTEVQLRPSYGFACADCQVGKAPLVQGKRSCDDCPPGSFQDLTGATGCKPCPRGTYIHKYGMSYCASCDKGRAATDTGQQRCAQCERGNFANNKGMSECALCAQGTFANLTGLSACVSCAWFFNDANAHTSSDGARSVSDCVCPRDFHYDGQRCKRCPAIGVRCPGGHPIINNSVDATPFITLGYMSRRSSYLDVYTCEKGTDRCPHDRLAIRSDLMCPLGFVVDVPQCAQCTQGRFKKNNKCLVCDDDVVLVACKISITILLHFFLFLYMYIRWNRPQPPGAITFGIMLVFLQIVNKMFMLPVTWPQSYKALMKLSTYFSYELPFAIAGQELACTLQTQTRAWATLMFETVLVPMEPIVIFGVWACLGKCIGKPLQLDYILNTIFMVHKTAFITIAGSTLRLVIAERMPGTGIRMVRGLPGVRMFDNAWMEAFPIALFGFCCNTLTFLTYLVYIVALAPRLAARSRSFLVRNRFAFGASRANRWWWVLARTVWSLVLLLLLTTSDDLYFLLFSLIFAVVFMVVGEFAIWPLKFFLNNIVSLSLWIALLTMLVVGPSLVDVSNLDALVIERNKQRCNWILCSTMCIAACTAVLHIAFSMYRNIRPAPSAKHPLMMTMHFRDVMLHLLLLGDRDFAQAVMTLDEMDLRDLKVVARDIIGAFLHMQPSDKLRSQRIITKVPFKCWDELDAMISGIESVVSGECADRLQSNAKERVAVLTFAHDLRAVLKKSSRQRTRHTFANKGFATMLGFGIDEMISFDCFWDKFSSHTRLPKEEAKVVFEYVDTVGKGEVTLAQLLRELSAAAPTITEEHAERLRQLVGSDVTNTCASLSNDFDTANTLVTNQGEEVDVMS